MCCIAMILRNGFPFRLHSAQPAVTCDLTQSCWLFRSIPPMDIWRWWCAPRSASRWKWKPTLHDFKCSKVAIRRISSEKDLHFFGTACPSVRVPRVPCGCVEFYDCVQVFIKPLNPVRQSVLLLPRCEKKTILHYYQTVMLYLIRN